MGWRLTWATRLPLMLAALDLRVLAGSNSARPQASPGDPGTSGRSLPCLSEVTNYIKMVSKNSAQGESLALQVPTAPKKEGI
ncbi:hypothetical protein ASPFODRAFT_48986 [Aspergillus luchuensis CBS 106.47]|uniref:Uncharacterized protein n=1 Tax=Aspergillus luchuensis (strain CBS 106.47) TaxID=1137211 RepID=A0A1M3TA49_ASPLC|nr:hypothetical protein ASPFODRAFT_48986 [Aspergillus luchuensis CBS 106.47]